ncbi:YkvA family protein [Bacillus sp. PS06]|uniref:YkvA family protein n=1 Tax=Bacillus sp. PS06 TaxID=2764176 RepID=UPI001783D9AF|nr:DUF1232 domain-containing protein [Bacillus sp. PS06]MBD8068532.1 DUF1232 domain-containing protein [Bacillus sp. PS06]
MKFLKRFAFILRFWKFIPFIFAFFKSKEVKLHYKLLCVLTILTYGFFPFDLIHDYIPVAGVIDDVVITAFVLERMIKIAPQSLKDKYKLT